MKAYTNTELEADKRQVSLLDITEEKKEVKRQILRWLYAKQPWGDMDKYRKRIIEV